MHLILTTKRNYLTRELNTYANPEAKAADSQENYQNSDIFIFLQIVKMLRNFSGNFWRAQEYALRILDKAGKRGV